MVKKILILLAGLSLLVPVLFALRETGSDQDISVLYPHPAFVLIPMFFGLRWVAFAVPTGTFFAWNPQLFESYPEIPKRSYILLLVVTFLTVFWFAAGWKDGLAIQGSRYNHALLVINIVWIAVLWLILFLNGRTGRSLGTSLLFHWLLFLWLAWQAFPFFGEMP